MTMMKDEQRVVGGEIGLHVDEQQHERARRADAGGAEAEGDGIEPAHVEPDDRGADLVVGAGADRLAGAGEAEEAPRAARRRPPRRAAAKTRTLSRMSGADLVGIERVVELHVARVGPEHHQHARW